MRLFSAATIQRAKQKMHSSPWRAKGWHSLEVRVSAWPLQTDVIPMEAGGWIHNYICPDHWEPLTYDDHSPRRHRCPAGHICTGEEFDAAWRVWRHRQIGEMARDSALAYTVMGLEVGRETAVAILNHYANFYTQFDGHSNAESWMLKGHAFNQALTEALWAIPIIHAYDLVADTLTQAQRERLRRDLWAPLTAVFTAAQDKLIAQNAIYHNYMAWMNVALGCLGLALNDQTLNARAIQPPAGFIAHLDQAILVDGLEFEGTPYYHNFVLLANLILAEAAQANGIDLQTVAGTKGQQIIGMGRALVNLAWPDGSIPDLGEGSYWRNSIYDSEICQVFELLYAIQPEPAFAWTLKAAYARHGADRDNWAALLYGRDGVATAVAPPSTHTVLEASGIAVLRTEKKLAAMIPFGPYRGHHHQSDRLSLSVWPFSRDAGSPLYGLPERQAWYAHSYAHNTLVVDGRNHADCGGELLDWNGRRLSVTAPDAYPGVRFVRVIAIENDTFLDRLVVEAPETHIFDWIFHLDGELEMLGELRPLSEPLAESGAGAYIELFAQQSISDTVSFDVRYDADRYRLTLAGEQPFTLLLGMAPGTSRQPQQKRHVLIGRTVGAAQCYQTTISQN